MIPMLRHDQILAAPKGLNLDEIATDHGLLLAVEREAAKLKQAETERRRISRDEIRLISFLAGEVRRRVRALSPGEREELARIRQRARHREIEMKVREMIEDVDTFAEEVDQPSAVVRFSRVNELETRAGGMIRALGREPEKYSEFLESVHDAMEKLATIKKRGRSLSGFADFE